MCRAVSTLVDDSTLTTVAPKSARARPITGPATTHDRSTTLSPSRGPGRPASDGRLSGAEGRAVPSQSCRTSPSCSPSRGAGRQKTNAPESVRAMGPGMVRRRVIVSRPARRRSPGRRNAGWPPGRTTSATSTARSFLASAASVTSSLVLSARNLADHVPGPFSMLLAVGTPFRIRSGAPPVPRRDVRVRAGAGLAHPGEEVVGEGADGRPHGQVQLDKAVATSHLDRRVRDPLPL